MNDIHGMPIMKNRRDILLNCLRGGALLALGGMASTLGWRSLHGTGTRTNPCGACPLLDGCALPKALDAKKPDGSNTTSGVTPSAKQNHA